MGRSLWIMDNVTPLQQLASLVAARRPRTSRSRTVTEAPLDATASEQNAARGTLPPVHLFQPRDTIRYRSSASQGGNGDPEYPAAAAHIDVWFQTAPPADIKLDVLDAKGQVIRSFGVGGAPGAGGGGGQGMRGPGGRGGGGASAIRNEAGMQRFNWDMRYPGVNNAPGGPMAPPGKYAVRLTAGGYNATRNFELKADPRVLKDGVTQADLDEQFAFLMKLRDAHDRGTATGAARR